MADSRLILASVLICSVYSSYGNVTSELATTNTSTIGNLMLSPFTGSASVADQPSQNQTCFPKSWNVLVEKMMIIAANDKCSPVKVLECYCITSESDVENGSLQHMNFGKCFYGCFVKTAYYKTKFGEQFDNAICTQFNRKGILCGQCKDGYGPAAYSFSLECVKCGNSTHWTRVPLYVLVAYGPLTVFLAIIVVFTVSVNSAPLHGWILVCQLLSTNTLMRIISSLDHMLINKSLKTNIRLLQSIYGMWNLDFFRSIYTPFCLHPNLTTLQVMSLDYIIATYPLVLIIVMYLLVDMYSRNYRPVVIMLRPIHYCFTRFRHQLNIRTSLVDAFGTFFTLSYVKFYSTTIDLLISIRVWDFYGNRYRVYYDGTMEPFKGQHIPYAVLGVLLCVLCNFLPLILILLYSFRRTHAILNCLPLSIRTMLFPFMDNILACYKDGTNGTKNCRYFGVVYHLAFISVLNGYVWTKSILMFGVNAFMCIVVGILVAVIQPYKAKVYNIVDTVLILSVGLGFVAAMCLWIAMIVDPENIVVAYVIAGVPFIFPLLFISGYLLLKVVIKLKVVCSLYKMRRLSEMGSISENTPVLPINHAIN